MKKVKRLFLSCAIAMLFLAFSFTHASAAQQKVLKLAFVAPPPVWGPVAECYAKEVAKISPNLDVKIFGGGQLGDLRKNLAEIKTGRLDMILCGAAVPSLAKGGGDMNVLYAPYIFNSQNHMQTFFKSEFYKSMIGKVEKEAGFKYLGYAGDRAPRLITTSVKAVVKPEDMKGLKLRVPLLKPISVAMQAWGATPVPLSAAELYMALKQGVVDGQDNGFDAIYSAKFYEVQKFVSPIDYVRQGLIILISRSVWDGLDPEAQRALSDAMAPTEKWSNNDNEEMMAKAIKGAQEKGMVILKPDLNAFKKTAAEAITKELDGNMWPAGLYDKIRAMEP
jgi:tripartite ATP-independent transporter DctP family solute receptor